MQKQFYNELQFYGTWSVMVFSALWIAFETYIWSRFIVGIKTWFFRSVIILLVFYVIYNGALIVVAITGSFAWAQVTVQDFNYISIQRMYSHTLIPLATALLFRTVNHRSKGASIKDQDMILNATRIIAVSQKERARAVRVEKEISEYVHRT